MRSKVYVVTMYRWGNPEGHSYIEGVYSDESVAQEQGITERIRRDCKYEPVINELKIDETLLCRRERILSLRKNLGKKEINTSGKKVLNPNPMTNMKKKKGLKPIF